MGKERIRWSSTRQQHIWFRRRLNDPSKFRAMNVTTPKSVLRDEELENYLSSKISQVMNKRAQHTEHQEEEEEEEEEEKESLSIHEIDYRLVDNHNQAVFGLSDCYELVIDEDPEILNLFSNSTKCVFESRSPPTLQMTPMEKKSLGYNHKTIEINPAVDAKCAEFYYRVSIIMQYNSSLKNYSNTIYWQGFKIIPMLNNWEYVLMSTRPKDWCPEATYLATVVFLSFHNLHQLNAFLPSILLKISVDFIQTHGFLHPMLNQALVQVAKTVPSLFCKSILILLNDPTQGGFCNLKVTGLFGDILTKAYLPSAIVSTTLLSFARFDPYFISHSVFIIVLLEKRPVLSFRVLASLVDHFRQSCVRHSKMPSLWYQSLYLFVDLYGIECVLEQKDQLFELCQSVFHPHWSPLIQQIIMQSPNSDRKEIMSVMIVDHD